MSENTYLFALLVTLLHRHIPQSLKENTSILNELTEVVMAAKKNYGETGKDPMGSLVAYTDGALNRPGLEFNPTPRMFVASAIISCLNEMERVANILAESLKKE